MNVNDAPRRQNGVSKVEGDGVRRSEQSELAQGLAALRQAMEAAAQSDNVTSLEMNRWCSTVKSLETTVARLEARSASQELVLAHALHDIRGTVTIVRGYAELALHVPGIEFKTRVLVQRILANTDTLNGILEELLTLFRCDAGKMRVTPSPVPLRNEISLVVEAFAHAAEKKGLAFQCAFREPLPSVVRVDVLLLRRILGNVLENAVKYTANGSIGVEVSHDGVHLVLRVQDTGPGIAETLVPFLFEPYQQRPEPTGRSAGSGLGLSVVRRLCRAMGGDAVLEGPLPEGRGSVFRLFVIAEAETVCGGHRPEE